MRLARADVEDLVALRDRLRSARVPDARLDMVQRALHAALVRQSGIEARGEIARASSLAGELRPIATDDGFTYVLDAVPDEASYGQGGGFGGWGPGGGGGTGGGQRQRLGPTASSHGTPRYLPGRMPSPPRSPPPLPPDEPDALERAQRVVDWFNKAADLFSAFSDPAGFIGGQPQGQVLSAGMDAAFQTSRKIDNSLKGQDDHASAAARVSPTPLLLARLSPASRGGPMPASAGRLGYGWVASTRQARTYREFARPRTIAFPQVSAGLVTEAHARAINATVATTLRMASTLSAVAATSERLAAAVAARDAEWEERQARAMIHLKRLAGTEMVQLARDLESLRTTAGNKPIVTEGEVRTAIQRIGANGWTPEARAVALELGLSASSIEERNRSSASLDPARMAREMPSYLSELGNALTDYGSLLAQLPEIRPPWN